MRYIGLDVHKENTTACVISAGGKALKNFEVPSSADGLTAIRDIMKDHEYCVMMESSTYTYPVFRFFSDLGIETYVVHARSLKMVTESTKKTDHHDAETIGIMLRLWKKKEIKGLSMSFIPTREQCELKDICRYCEELSMKIGTEKRRIGSHLYRNCRTLPPEYDDLGTKKTRKYISETWPEDPTLQKRMKELETLMKESKNVKEEVVSRLPEDDNVKLLETIPGVAGLTGVQLMSMIIRIDRFPDPENFCSYFGMVPKVHDSGGKKYHGRMTKQGDKMMRAIMERVTSVHVMHCESSVTEYYRRKVKEMGVKKALITASRKMLTMIYAMLRDRRPFKA